MTPNGETMTSTEPREYDGLNGHRVLTVTDVPVGRIPGESYGYQRDLLVTVNVRMERRERDAQTIDHETISGHLDFAITVAVWQPNRNDITASYAGSDEPLRQVLAHGRYEDGMDADKVRAFMELDAWHLNTMTAACAHQTPVGEDIGERLDNTPPCPVTGYKYGHAWLVRPLPAGFHADVLALFADVDRDAFTWTGAHHPRIDEHEPVRA
jgi:hypothetical protein